MYCWKMIKKLRNIIIGWYRYLFRPVPTFAENRRKICSKCSYNEDVCGIKYCSLCGCVIAAKTLVEDEQCYDNRW